MNLFTLIFLLIIIILLISSSSRFSNLGDNLNTIDYLNEYSKRINIETRFTYYNNNINLNGVEQIYIIVMPDRVNYMKEKLNKMSINYTLFNAITPNNLIENEYEQLTGDKYFIKKKTRLPVQLSFTMCYMNAIKNNYSTIIVFEDDIIVNIDNKTLEKSINEFKINDYIMFYMGYCELNCNQYFNSKEHNYIVNVPNYSRLFCAHAICYKVKYLPEIINYIYPMIGEFDIRLTEFIKYNNYKVCISKNSS